MATGGGGNRATTQILFAPVENGLTKPVAFLEGTVTNKRGQKLYTVDYLPGTESETRAVCIFHHGLAEHIGRYKEAFIRLAAGGLSVYAYDAHGHGKSEPKEEKFRAYVDKFSDLTDDMEERLAQVVAAYKEAGKTLPPVILAGHSLGGTVAALVAAKSPASYAGLILHSAAIDVEWTLTLKCQAACGGCLAGCVPLKRIVPAVRPEDMSQDKAVVKDYVDDPLNTIGEICARTGNESLKAFKSLGKLHSKLTMPIYCAHGTADKTCSIKAARNLVAKAGAQAKEMWEVAGGYHELLMGPERDACITHLLEWVVPNMLGGAAATGSPTKTSAGGAPVAPAQVQLAAK